MSMWNKEASQTVAGQPGQAVSPAAPGPEVQAAAAPGLPERLGGVPSGLPERLGGVPPGLPERLGGVPHPETERRQVAWVGKSVVFKGELSSSEDMIIDGRVEGIIELREHTLTIGRDARIHADIEARTVVVLGHLEGAISATDKIVLGEHAVVDGNLTTARISVTEGAIVRGRLETTAKVAAKQPARETARKAVAVAV
jgi:cytoskeletal protein CcmA (bactofilin family)